MPKIQRIQLPNGCSCTPPIIQPKDWKRNIKKDWTITCRFYEPERPVPFQYAVKGMNHLKNFQDRKRYTEESITAINRQLLMGYNPRLNVIITPKDVAISPMHPFLTSLDYACSKLKGVKGYLNDVRSAIKGIKSNAGDVIDVLVGDIETIHLEAILERCKETNMKFTANRHNRYRSYLVSLFKVLKKHRAIKSNPAIEIERLKSVKKIRKTTSAEERKKISDHLRLRDYPFWRFVQIFFHSGSRESELMRLQGKDVNLKKQTFKCLVKKGREYREMEGVIKNSVLPLWEEILKDCGPEQYLFSKGLLPGEKPIRPDQVGRRWHNMVKRQPQKKYARWGGLGIDANLYSLKHTNTTQIAGILSDEDAARMNKHTSTAMVVKIYDVERGDRQAERLKNVGNEF